MNTILFWFRKRFVLLCEIAGYTITLAVGVFMVYAVFSRVEVTVTVSGPLEPVTVAVTAPDDVLPVKWLAVDNALVAEGEPVCAVVSGPEQRRRARALILLGEAEELLGSNTDPASTAARESVRSALQSLPEDQPDLTLTAPTAGGLRVFPERIKDGLVSAGTPLAEVYDVARYQVEAAVADSGQAARIAAGQRARVRVADVGILLEGSVTAVSANGEEGARVTVLFENAPEAYRAHFTDLLTASPPGAVPAADVRVVVGSRSLFMEIFGKKNR